MIFFVMAFACAILHSHLISMEYLAFFVMEIRGD
jgi:hypothetical protein